MKKIVGVFIAFAAMASAPFAYAENAAGDWTGVLKTPGGELRLVAHISKDAAGIFGGSLDSVDQGATGLQLADVASDGVKLSFALPTIRGAYQGVWSAEKKQWIGEWKQGASSPLNFARGLPAPRPKVTGLDGNWQGVLKTRSGADLRLVLKVKTDANGTLATLDSPDQLAFGLAIRSLTRDGQNVSFEMAAMPASFSGSLGAGRKAISGQWTQGGVSSALTFAPGEASYARARPQTPTKPYAYSEEEVAFAGGAANVSLAGSVTLPTGAGPFPAAILIAGSGANDRDETILGHKPFLVIADYLTKRGVALLRYDKRGVGKSGGDYGTATSADFAADAAAAVRYLRSRKDIDAAKIGLIGHSEGGMIAPIVAAGDKQIAFMVLMAGPGLRGDEVLIAQQKLIWPRMGLAQDKIDARIAMEREVWAAASKATNATDAAERAGEVLQHSPVKLSPQEIEAFRTTFSSDWFRYFLNYDPGPILGKVKAPVLALNGELDMQVPAKENLAAIKTALAGNQDVTIVELPKLNHLFQTAKTGAVGEYIDIEETVSPVALNTIGDWIDSHASRSPSKR